MTLSSTRIMMKMGSEERFYVTSLTIHVCILLQLCIYVSVYLTIEYLMSGMSRNNDGR